MQTTKPNPRAILRQFVAVALTPAKRETSEEQVDRQFEMLARMMGVNPDAE